MRRWLVVLAAFAVVAAACSDEGSPAVSGQGTSSSSSTSTTAGGGTTTIGAGGPSTTGGPTNTTTKADFTVKLTGASEVPAGGDKDGSGTAAITLVEERGEVCYEISVKGIGKAGAAHLHRAAKGAAGDVVLDLSGPFDGKTKGCAAANTVLVDDIRATPEMFYVNVHTDAFPDGAIRGQLR